MFTSLPHCSPSFPLRPTNRLSHLPPKMRPSEGFPRGTCVTCSPLGTEESCLDVALLLITLCVEFMDDYLVTSVMKL